MKILQTSDTHWGITKPNTLRKMFKKIVEQKVVFDIILYCGDYSGERNGFKATRGTIRLLREFFPDVPIVTVLGNHDFWTTGTKVKLPMGGYSNNAPSLESFNKNYMDIVGTFINHDIHFLDEDGIYVHDDWPDIKIFGHSGWYAHPNPPTNDIGYMPHSNDEGVSSHLWLLNRAEKALQEQFDQLDKIYDPSDTVCFVSHFPVIKVGRDYKGRFEDFSWRESVGDFIKNQYNCKYFFCGHAHQYHNGPLRYECGSDYGNPEWQVVEIL